MDLPGRLMQGSGTMARFTHDQTKIALALLKGEKSIPELGKTLGEDNSLVEKELKEMQKLGLVGKKADSFALKPEIVKEIRRRKELEEQDSFNVRLKAFVEAQALSKSEVEKHLKSLEAKMKKDPEFRLYKLEKGATKRQQDYYSGFIEVNFSARGFGAIIKFILVFAPSVIEVVKPRKIEATAFDFQEGLMDLATWVYKYNNFITQHMKRREIENFNKSLFQQKKK